MLATIEETVSVHRRVQLTFDFAAPEKDKAAKLPRRRRAQARKQTKSETAPAATNPASGDVTAVCCLLHELARKFVPPTAIHDYSTFARCSAVLQKTGAIPKAVAHVPETVTEHENALITNAPIYRNLKNTAIAGLATVADLNGRAPAKGSPDYQKGMRDAYQYASEVAIMFLEEIQPGI